MTECYNLGNIRLLLSDGFNDLQLRTLCFDNPELKEVYTNWSSGISKIELALQIIDYADKQSKIETVLNWAKAANPSKYEKYKPYTVSCIEKQCKIKSSPWAPIVAGIVVMMVLFVALFQPSIPIPTPKPVCIKVDFGQTPTDLTVSAGGTSILTVTARSGIVDICLPYAYEGQQVELKAKAEGFVPRMQTIPLTPNATPVNFVLTPMPTSAPTSAPRPTSTPWVLANAKVYPMEGAQCITEVTGSDPTRPGMIKIMFDTTNKGSWCTWVINLGRFNASQKTHLAFWVRGEEGGERFDVGIKDATTLSGDEPKMEQTTSTEWRRVLIPLRDMQNIKQQDLSALENFSLGFTDKLGSGIIYVQGFVFEP